MPEDKVTTFFAWAILLITFTYLCIMFTYAAMNARGPFDSNAMSSSEMDKNSLNRLNHCRFFHVEGKENVYRMLH